jgi:FMN-dependent NADH-azoreductase
MPTLLQIDSSPLESSISRELTREFVKTWKAAHGDGHVIHRDLASGADALKSIDAAWIHAAFTPTEALQPEQADALALSDRLIAELEQADEYVFGVAMHNFAIPSVLKLWIDQVVRGGRTFSYGENGTKGLLQGKKATILVASGGVYEQGTPRAALDFTEPYLRAVLGFIGVTALTFVKAGGMAQLRSGAIDRADLLRPALEQVRAAAA